MKNVKKVISKYGSFLLSPFLKNRSSLGMNAALYLIEIDSKEFIEMTIEDRYSGVPGEKKIEIQIKRKGGETEVTLFDQPVPRDFYSPIMQYERLAKFISEKLLINCDPSEIKWRVLYRNWERNYDHLMGVEMTYYKESGYYGIAVYVPLSQNPNYEIKVPLSQTDSVASI